ncbi:MAG: ABC transporter ATP-binding protein [Thermodesulfovibrionales bacterium]|nr:ABC transporter ATP-binding protein [Thermodesulfovibrionales bacterium]
MYPLQIDNISFSYNSLPFIENVSFTLSNGEFACIMGPNASGKSTLLKISAGMLKPLSGRVILWGKEIQRYKGKDRAKLISYLPQMLDFSIPIRVIDILKMGFYPYQIPPDLDISAALKWVGLTDKKDMYINQLSGGEIKRAFIAMTLIQGAGILLLDEPIANLDIKYQLELVRLLKDIVNNRKISVLMAIHDLNLALQFDRVILIKAGKIISDGEPFKVINEENLRDVFDIDVKIHPSDNGKIFYRYG